MYVGIDQSYGGFGLTMLCEDGKFVSIVQKFSAEKYGSGIERLISISEWLTATLARRSTPVAHVVMEGYSRNSKFRREEMAALATMVRYTLFHSFPPPVGFPTIIAPTKLKLFAAGKGNATKKEMVAAVNTRWGVSLRNDNAADSYAAAQVAKTLVTGQTRYEHERKALEGLTMHTDRMAS